MTVLWLLINLWPSIVLIALTLEREKTGVPGEKPSKHRSTAGTLSHTRLGFSGERRNALTTCEQCDRKHQS